MFIQVFKQSEDKVDYKTLRFKTEEDTVISGNKWRETKHALDSTGMVDFV